MQKAKEVLHGRTGQTLKGRLSLEDPGVSSCKAGVVRKGKLLNRRKCLLKVLTEKLATTLGAVSLGTRPWNQKHPWKLQLASLKYTRGT